MLALQSYEQANGFSAMSADELFYVNGGNGSSGNAPQKIQYTIPANSGSSSLDNGVIMTNARPKTQGSQAAWLLNYLFYGFIFVSDDENRWKKAADYANKVTGRY